jgi:hypothetical protein
MNREFKFRVWDKKFRGKKQMVCADNDGRLFVRGVEITLQMLTMMGTRFNDRYVIQQFTGFKDVNKKEIYEGDIFKGDYYKWGAVEFVDGNFVVNLKGARRYALCELFYDTAKGDYPEVVGNIFENPELIKNEIH